MSLLHRRGRTTLLRRPENRDGLFNVIVREMARVHREDDLKEFGEWICPCWRCEHFRKLDVAKAEGALHANA